MRLLVQDTASNALSPLVVTLRAKGHAVDQVRTVDDAIEQMLHVNYDVVIIAAEADMLSAGLEQANYVKLLRDNRVLAMLPKALSVSLPRLLSSGVDDFILGNFLFEEFDARLRGVIDRPKGNRGLISVGNLVVDQVGRTAEIVGKSLELTNREFAVLEILLSSMGRLVTKERIAAHVFSTEETGDTSTIRIYVHRLRRKLRDSEFRIRGMRGVGYIIEHIITST